MITMRSNSAAPRKVHKPPPPVPPRPSKILVQEALAKTRQGHDNLFSSDSTSFQNNGKSPVRQAPPPPAQRSQIIELNKSFSSGQVNVVLKKQAPQAVTSLPSYERSISVDKVSSRPVVYQSDNSKRQPAKTDTTKGSEVKRIESFKRNNSTDLKCTESIKKVSSEVKNASVYNLKRSESIKKDQNASGTKRLSSELKRMESFKKYEEAKKNSSLRRTNSKKVENVERVVLNESCDLEKTDILLNDSKIRIASNEYDIKSRTSTLESGISSKMSDSCGSSNSSKSNSLEKKWDKMLNDRNHVNTLIDEMFASVLDVSSGTRTSSNESIIKDTNDNKIIISNKTENNVFVNKNSGDNLTVIVISDDSSSSVTDENKSQSGETNSNTSTTERKVKFNDQMNHELLINELQNMKNDQEKILKRQRLPSVDLGIVDDNGTDNIDDKIHTNDWYGVNEGKEVKMSSCHITIEDAYKETKRIGLDFDRINKMSHLHGLPPLPKSLSGFNFMESQHQGPQRQTPPTPIRSSSIRSSQGPQLTPTHLSSYQQQSKTDLPSKKLTNLDTQIAILRREMYSLRQQDLSLLSQLWSLNESIQDFRQILQDQEDRVLSPPSPSPTPSSADDEEFYLSSTSLGYRPPSGIIGRKLSGSSVASGSIG